MTREELIEKAAEVIRETSGRQFHGTAYATALADAGLLADPENTISLTYYREVATGYKGQMARADALQAQLDAARAVVEKGTDHGWQHFSPSEVRQLRAALQGDQPGEDRHGRSLGGDRERDGRLLAAAQGVDLTAGAADNSTRAYWYQRADEARARLANWTKHPSDCLCRRGYTCPIGGVQ
ncbi:MAG TPA: hypothetical protein VGL36_15160 [Kribbella sp.]